MLDIKRYIRLQPKGLVSVEKCVIADDENCCALQFKRFSVEDGSEIEPEVQKCKIADLQTFRDELNSQIDGLNTILYLLSRVQKKT